MIFSGCFLLSDGVVADLFLFSPNPAAANGAGVWGAQPLSNRFFPPTHNVEEPFFQPMPIFLLLNLTIR